MSVAPVRFQARQTIEQVEEGTELAPKFDGSNFGMGVRSQRYAAVIDDGVVKTLAVEKPMKFDVSSAEAILAAL